MQDEAFDGFGAIVDRIMNMAEARLDVLNPRRRETCPASDLVVGLQCGGSDAFSGVTANPAFGFAADLLVRAGATVMFSEVTEVRDAIHLLRPAPPTGSRRARWSAKWLGMTTISQAAAPTAAPTPRPATRRAAWPISSRSRWARSSNPAPAAISGVLSPGERVRKKGLIFAATPASDFICGTLQLASGMTLQVFTTGRGTPYGLAAAPVIKVSTRTELARRWNDLIDFDAGRIATGEATIEETGWDYSPDPGRRERAKKVWSDQWGLFNELTLFNPAPVT